ncbi:MAG: terminase small subunit [Dehalococcoidia bacterium]
MALKGKREQFPSEFIKDCNATAAAKRSGYSVKTAYSQGQRLLKDVEIQAAIALVRQELSIKTGITPEKVIQGFADIAFADLADCYNEDGTLKNIHDIPKASRMALAGLDVFEEFVGRGEDRVKIGETKKIKRWDPHKGLDSLAKYFGLYDADNKQRQVPFCMPINLGDDDGL